VKRRNFVTALGVAAGTAALPPPAAAAGGGHADDTYAVLVDLTKCIGCRSCEQACAEANGLPAPDLDEELSASRPRETTDARWTVVNLRNTSRGEVHAKSQCMHCLEPACAAACLTRALHKTSEGPVVWTASKCMGCRFCMVSCPFDGPKFEYHSAVPRIRKCKMCFERLVEGRTPACVENCVGEALTFGRRGELLELARRRIYQNPGTYVSHIYGEHEAGGTSWLYLSPVPFEQLGFRTDLGTGSYPERTRDFLTAVPLVLIGWPAMLLGLRRATAPSEAGPVPAAGPQAGPTAPKEA
jgi:Fe-S-cluster-containing dehydrogenase component